MCVASLTILKSEYQFILKNKDVLSLVVSNIYFIKMQNSLSVISGKIMSTKNNQKKFDCHAYLILFFLKKDLCTFTLYIQLPFLYVCTASACSICERQEGVKIPELEFWPAVSHHMEFFAEVAGALNC